MTGVMLLGLTATMAATAFVSGIFGMAGGMILLGVLLSTLSLPGAMALHAVTQITSNGWRGLLWVRYVHWGPAGWFLLGCATSFAAWSTWRYVPPLPLTLMLLGATPFLIRLMPRELKPDPDHPVHGFIVGAGSMTLMLMSGVSGPLIDTFFLSGRFERREVVATKAVCQVCCHAAKLVYYNALVAEAGALDPWIVALGAVATVAGTTLAVPVLERMSDGQYRTWSNQIITAIACVYVAQGCYQLATSTN